MTFEPARADVDPAMARVFLNVSAEYYPERLGHFVVLDAPSVFNMLFKVPPSPPFPPFLPHCCDCARTRPPCKHTTINDICHVQTRALH